MVFDSTTSHDPDDDTPSTLPLDGPSNVTSTLLPVDVIAAATAFGGSFLPIRARLTGCMDTSALSARHITPPLNPITVPDRVSVAELNAIDSVAGDVQLQDVLLPRSRCVGPSRMAEQFAGPITATLNVTFTISA